MLEVVSYNPNMLTKTWVTLDSIGHLKSWHHVLILDNIEKFKNNLSYVLNTFENIMENAAFALLEKMNHFP